jgi:deoxyribose-phosphate aldolase
MYTEKYNFQLAENDINAITTSVIDNITKWSTKEVLTRCISLIDLTTLNVTDTKGKVKSFVEKVNGYHDNFPGCPYPASICIFPNFSKVVKDNLKAKGVHITAVSGAFPASQSFIEVKKMEAKMAVDNGANEIDIVLALNAFLETDFAACTNEIQQIKKSIAPAHLKVILETGALETIENIANASFLAMEAGADFIKTSTGKISTSATPFAAVIMCQCIKLFHQKTGKKIGFKPAGGISTAQDASIYYGIVDTILGKEWLTPSLFRFGASRMANNLIEQIKSL